MDEIRLNADQGFDYHVSHLRLYLFNVEAILRQLDPDAVEAPLVTSSSFRGLVSRVISIILINSIISQMYKRIIISFLLILFA
jgi:hypothetical protein